MLWEVAMKKSLCKHCGQEIGEWTDPWGGHPQWMHAPDDGPDAYETCRCKCADCYQPLGTGPCIDGEVADPIEGAANV